MDLLDAYLNDAHVRHFACLVNWDLGNAFNPILDRVRDMGNDLNCLPKVLSFSLTLQIWMSRIVTSEYKRCAPPSQ